MVEFGGDLEITYVMGGLAREFGDDPTAMIVAWLDVSERSGMPVDPRLWTEAAPSSSYPACMAVKAAAEQGLDGPYLRRLREALMCERVKADNADAFAALARDVPGLDVDRFAVDIESHAIVEAFGADLEETRTIPAAARERGLAREATHGSKGERLAFPTIRFGDDSGEEWCGGDHSYEEWRTAAMAVGARPADEPPRDVLAALRRFGRMATPEVETVCRLPGPRASAELWRLAAEWRVRPTRVLTGTLWEIA